MITDLTIILLAMFSAWEEVQQLIQRGSWKKKDYRIPIWETDPKGKWKLFDSHHIAFGFFTLAVFSFAYFVNVELWLIPVYWIVFFWLRNIFMHIVFKRKPLWKYLYTFWR